MHNIQLIDFIPALEEQLCTLLSEHVQDMSPALKNTLICSRYCQKLLQSNIEYLSRLKAWHQQLLLEPSGLSADDFDSYFSQHLMHCGKLMASHDAEAADNEFEAKLRLARQHFMLRWCSN